MKKILLLPVFTGLVCLFVSCKKAATDTAAVTAGTTVTDAAAKAISPAPAPLCSPGYYNLALDPVTGNSLVYKISGSPSAGPVAVVPIIGSLGDNVVRVGGVPVTKMTGLAVDPASGTAWGITSSGGSFPNHQIKFLIGNPNVATAIPIAPGCVGTLNLSDLERDPASGNYYAINSSAGVPADNRIVRFITGGAPTVVCLPNPVPLGTNLRGLTFDCGGTLFVAEMLGPNARIYKADKVTGLLFTNCLYSGPVSPGGVGAPEMGLHFDCACINKYITGDFRNQLLTDGGAPCLYAGAYAAALPGTIKPTVDFARP